MTSASRRARSSEQRIGRIDRYGEQSESVAIVNLVTPGTVDADIYQRCLMRIGVFHHAVGCSEEILGEITREIHNIADSFTLTPAQRAERLQQLGDNKIRQVQEETALEEKQAELFGLTVPDQSWREEIAEAESFWLSSAALQRCVTAYLSGVAETDGDFLLGDKPLKTLRLGQKDPGQATRRLPQPASIRPDPPRCSVRREPRAGAGRTQLRRSLGESPARPRRIEVVSPCSAA